MQATCNGFTPLRSTVMDNTLEYVATPPVRRPAGYFGVRHVQILLMFFGLLIAYTLRVNLSVAIVAMVDKENANPNFEEFQWDEKTQSVLLSSFFWGYVITQLPSGPLIERFGAKTMLAQAVLVSSLFACLTPLAALGGWGWVCAIRVLQGLSQGCVAPSMHTMLAHWAPVSERGRLSTWAYAGAIVATIITLPLCGLLATSPLGWPSNFYLFGAAGIVWTIIWIIFGSSSPLEHSSITQGEREYILDTAGVTAKEDKAPVPWRYILTSWPLWGIVAAHCGQYWGFWTLLTEMPTYMKTVLNFDLKSNGLLSAVPYLGQWILSFFFGWLSDFLNKRKLLSLVVSRKLFNTIGQWIPAVALVGLGYTRPEDATLCVVLLSVTVSINSAIYVGFNINHIDLSPNYAGTLIGITNCLGNIMSIIAPLVVGVIVTDEGNVIQWRTVFLIAALFYFFANLVFVLIGKADVQPWNDPHAVKLAQVKS